MAQKIKLPIDILFEDNHLLVANKPAGLLTQPTKLVEDSLLVYLKKWIKTRDDKKGNVFLEPIHRIDKPVSGVVVFAKTQKGLSRLTKSIREKECTKLYLAKVSGKLPKTEGILEHFLIHDEFRARIANRKDSQAKLARLSYKMIKKNHPFYILEIQLDTGRYHQIRAQLAEIGCPIVGDVKYKSPYKLRIGQIALHHWKFSIPHPIHRELLTFEAPFSLDFLV